MSAEVLAIGPFRRALLPVLSHSAERYAATREGVSLVESVIPMLHHGNTVGRELAHCLGVEPWDFNTHVFDPWRVDLEALRAFLGRYLPGCAAHRSLPARETCEACRRASSLPVDKLILLREAGFEFFFLPNG
ncbi:hypothetical protein F0U60_22950 [Archangium minus]|uniref:Uncharacterized protein n=1 Tax=Archangium minus TaxID=83450 RepID=A0ABY9WV48_9BACT|nr:hypothetical protein F0U60_22950 [Archangium minus]